MHLNSSTLELEGKKMEGGSSRPERTQRIPLKWAVRHALYTRIFFLQVNGRGALISRAAERLADYLDLFMTL